MVRLGAPFERHVEHAAHEAVAAVRADHVGSADRLDRAARILRVDRHAGVVLRKARYGVSEQHLYVREALQPLKQDAVGKRLNERIAARPAEFVGAWFDRSETAARARDEAHPVVRRRMGQQFLCKADRLEHAQGFIVEADGCAGSR